MSDAADPSSGEDDHGRVQSTMPRGDARERTDGPVVFTDSICCVCQNVSVCNVPATVREWEVGQSFMDYCKACSEETPHNIKRLLTGVNRNHERGYLYEPDDE
jgi:hypothetical protein